MKNTAILIGNVGKDPEFVSFDNGGRIGKFALATSKKWTDKQTGEMKEKTQWHNVIVHGRTVDVVEKYVKKGDLLCVTGEIDYKKWEKDGETKYMTEIICQELKMLGDRKQAQEQPKTETNTEGVEDDLPF